MAVGGRFDIEAVRRKAAEEKRKAKRKAVISYALNGAIVVVLCIVGKIGWDKWQAHREEVRQQEEAEKAREERAKAEAARKKAEREQELREERERKRRETQERREEERRRKFEEERLAKERKKANEEWIEEHKPRVERALAKLNFDVEKNFTLAKEYEKAIDASVDGERWSELETAVRTSSFETFFTLANAGGAVSNYVNCAERGLPDAAKIYPDDETLDALVALVAAERFTMTVTLHAKGAALRQAILLSPDTGAGLAIPVGCKEFGGDDDSAGWTPPVTLGSPEPLFVLSRKEAAKYNREWSKVRRGVLREAQKLQDKDAYVETRLAAEMKTFLASVRARMAVGPEEAEAADKAKEKDGREKPSGKRNGSRRGLSAGGSSFGDSNESGGDIRSFGRGGVRRTL